MAQVLSTHPINVIAWIPYPGAIGFGASQREQQNRVWVGHGKGNSTSTRHSHWRHRSSVENLKLLSYDDPEKMELLDELRSDVTRLELIAERFSKIGPSPILKKKKKTNLNQQLDQCRSYMEKRASKSALRLSGSQ
ncbi:MAG: hypothetical protein IPK94_05970 [Saprospiraceae bacterium]|nr:hypothetical protein [Saprospiraceae bacterium]